MPLLFFEPDDDVVDVFDVVDVALFEPEEVEVVVLAVGFVVFDRAAPRIAENL